MLTLCTILVLLVFVASLNRSEQTNDNTLRIGSTLGEAKQTVILREECARLRTQVDSLTEARDRERVDKMSALERAREARRQLDEIQDNANQLKLELENRRTADHKLHVEVAELRSRVQV